MAMTQSQRAAAIRHLQAKDPIMRELIRDAGEFNLKIERKRFAMLVRSIISQQISTGAARSIRKKLESRVGTAGLTESSVGSLSVEELRSVGVSPQKASYLLDLATKVSAGEVRLKRIGRLANEQVILELTQVKGIGRWTAQMFLIFSLGRLDIFPYDDLGVRNGIRELYGFAEMPTKAECLEVAKLWSPYESVASWYCWRAVELKRAA